ncbi:hypothetical protein C7S18_04900 [Ahniella affigens]|uniref:Tail sheath protein C-terminal domain-containing protein n=1 Tax=Ahniella affigens TaxID=2021234 RepID=A0A2P1PP13_9GAMM|nr:phage tail sheath C-terminal domain-containing protein [Ahniella affigens]AVP96580.1 hypothetical protein C7S18_04900 [Ahniella affigens]
MTREAARSQPSASPISGASTSITAFLGRTPTGPTDTLQAVASFAEFSSTFGPITTGYPLTDSVYDFFNNGGTQALIVRVGAGTTSLSDADLLGVSSPNTGLALLANQGGFNLLCIPPDQADGALSESVIAAAAQCCLDQDAMLILDPPPSWLAAAKAGQWDQLDPSTLVSGEPARATAVYFPRIMRADLLYPETTKAYPPSGAIAGIFSRFDRDSGVWIAPAGTLASLQGIAGFEIQLTDQNQEQFTGLGTNALRSFSNFGPVIWGARTARGADVLADDFKYVPQYRLYHWIRRSILDNTRWAVFEPSTPVVWASLQASISVFMNTLMQQGAFNQFAVQCDATTNSSADIERGLINLNVLYDAFRPAEFTVMPLQIAAQAAS